MWQHAWSLFNDSKSDSTRLKYSVACTEQNGALAWTLCSKQSGNKWLQLITCSNKEGVHGCGKTKRGIEETINKRAVFEERQTTSEWIHLSALQWPFSTQKRQFCCGFMTKVRVSSDPGTDRGLDVKLFENLWRDLSAILLTVLRQKVVDGKIASKTWRCDTCKLCLQKAIVWI